MSGECADGGGLVRQAASGGLGAVSDGSGGLAECGLWRRVLDRVGVAAAGGFTFRLFLFFSLSFLFYTARRQAPMTKIGRDESIPLPVSFFL